MFRLIASCTFIALTITHVAKAQMPKSEQPKATGPDLKAMYEDIEILRRILIKEFGMRPATSSNTNLNMYDEPVRRGIDWLYQNRAANSTYDSAIQDYIGAVNYLDLSHPNANSFWAVKRPAAATIEGAYLKGHGVTYTLSVNATEQTVYDAVTRGLGLVSVCVKCHLADSVDRFVNPPNPSRAPPKLSDWEKARREVKGEKTEPQPSIASSFRMQSICAPGNLSEKILKVLAENGHNFKQLPGAENLTVVITFAPPRVEATESYRKANVPAPLRAAEDHAALGDLHLKQQKFAEAIASYAEAIKQLESGPLTLSFPADTNYDRVQQVVEDAQKLLRGSYTKKAQALLASGKTSEAKDALTKAETANVKVNMADVGRAPKVSPNMPAKLLITVAKKALDSHHDGKLSLDQLRKEAEVQTINLPAADKKK
jgi:tetratricopeptide (TPR) repeat protein